MGQRGLLIACLNVLNEEEYLETCLKSLEPVVDGFVIMETATKFQPLHKNGRSVDKTWDIVEKFQKRSRVKVVAERMGIVEDRVQAQNAFLSMVSDNNYVLFTGADETWDADQVLNVKRYLTEHPAIVEVFVNQVEMRHDFHHRLRVGYGGENLFYDKMGMRLCNGYVQERIYKKFPGVSYKIYHTHVSDGNGRALYGDGAYQQTRIFGSMQNGIFICFYHAGVLCNYNKYEAKKCHLIVQNEYKKSWSEMTEPEKKACKDKVQIDWDKLHSTSRLVSDFRVPKILESHPYYKIKSPDDIKNDERYKI